MTETPETPPVPTADEIRRAANAALTRRDDYRMATIQLERRPV